MIKIGAASASTSRNRLPAQAKPAASSAATRLFALPAVLPAVFAGFLSASFYPSRAESAESASFVASQTAFALKFHETVKDPGSNLFVSPYSIAVALAMTLNGASGATAAQMAHALQLPTAAAMDQPAVVEANRGFSFMTGSLMKSSRDCELLIANSLWRQTDFDFLPEYIAAVRDSFGADVNTVDFKTDPSSACKTINDWVAGQTRGRIIDLMKPGTVLPLTRLVLVNAIYFKGLWLTPFPRHQTTTDPFFLLNGELANVPMMSGKAGFAYAEAGGMQIVELPYAGGSLSMVVLLPRQKDGLPAIERRLREPDLSAHLAKLEPREIVVFLPKFKLQSDLNLVAPLKSLGMTDAFTFGKADFSGMNGNTDLFISAVVHKTYIDVNEEGTEAAAATGVAVSVTSFQPSSPRIFRADHPFLFVIRDRVSGSILFMGRVVNPAK